MRARPLLIATGVVALLGLNTDARQSLATDEDYDAAMKELGLTVGDAEGHIDARYWPELDEASTKMFTAFQQVEAFWQARENDRAAEIAAMAIERTRALAAASGERDVGAAQAALAELRETCQSCHREFRERTDDGFRIRTGP